ncbi:MAG: MBL fold metallo-hydrolase [Fidelibacterota bacterium]
MSKINLEFPQGSRALLTIFILVLSTSCYIPKNIRGIEIENQLVNWEKIYTAADIKLHVFNTGMNRVSPLLVGSPAPWRPAPAFLIEHPTFGLIVFDTGLSTEAAIKGEKVLHPITRCFFKTSSLPGHELSSQLKQFDFNPEDVTMVIFSHLHFDHVGNGDDFLNADYYISDDNDLEDLPKMDGFNPELIASIEDSHSFHRIDFSSGVPFGTFEKTIDLLGDGTMILIEGNGHLTGSMGIILRLPLGPVLLPGDEAVHFDWLKGNDIQRISKNPEQAANMRNRIQKLIELVPDLVVIPGHDLSNVPDNRVDIILHHPELYTKELWPTD